MRISVSLRALAIFTALALPLTAAHATSVTYTATASLTDTSDSADLVSATFGGQDITSGGAISFTDPSTSSISDWVKICLNDGYWNNADEDAIDLKVVFSTPGTGTGNINGTVDLDGYWNWFDNGNTINWTSPTSQNITLSNGSVVNFALTGLDHGKTDLTDSWCDRNTVCGTTDFTLSVTTNDPPASPTPEPASLSLLGTGIVGLAGLVRRKMHREA